MRTTSLAATALAVLALACGGEPDASGSGAGLEETGTISADDAADPNHAGLLYDGYVFSADAGRTVRAEVSAEEFTPMLKLVEVDTGAVLAEWDSAYATEDALTYRLAASGEYEARVYSTEGFGDYLLSVDVFE